MSFLVELLKSIFTEWLLYWLPIVGAALAAYLKGRGVNWVDPVTYGVVVGAAIFVGISSWRVMSLVSSLTPQVTAENIERLVRDWSDTFSYTVKKQQIHEDFFWGYEMSAVSNLPITVRRTKQLPNYVILIGALNVDGEHPKLIAAMNDKDRISFMADLRIEMNRMNMGFTGFTVPPKQLIVMRQLPIDRELTAAKFATTFQEVGSALILIRQTFLKTFGATGQLAAATAPPLTGGQESKA